MKVVFCLALLACVALTFGEECRSEDDCTHVTCAEDDYVLECHEHQCTCSHVSQTCTSADDCDDDGCDNEMHCVDNVCRCGYGFGGGAGGAGGAGGGRGRR